MSFNPKQFRELVVRPTLKYLSPEIPYSREAEDLLVMTAAHESNLGEYLHQVNGPALGIFQMEPATHEDIWDNYLEFNEKLGSTVGMLTDQVNYGGSDELIYNIKYATVMARVHYWRVKEPLPKREAYRDYLDYIVELSVYAKKHYNTHLGKATADDYYLAYVHYYGEEDPSE